LNQSRTQRTAVVRAIQATELRNCVSFIQGCNQNFILRVFSSVPSFISFSFSFLSFTSFYSVPRSGPLNPIKGFGGPLLASPSWENDICSHQTRPWALNTSKCVCCRSPPQKRFDVWFLEPRERVWWLQMSYFW